MTLMQTIRSLKLPLLEDGKISLGETSLLLRAVRPYVLKGDGTACELRDLLMRVRQDGVITPDESVQLCNLMERISTGGIRLDQFVRVVPDFPKPGAVFHDATGLLDTPRVFNLALDLIGEALQSVPFDLVAAPEPRGFIFGAAIAARFGRAFVPVRKYGRLPREEICEEYDREDGKATLHMHADAVIRGERVVIVDDLLASGGTAAAMARMVERLGGKVTKMIFPVELEGYAARENALKGREVFSLVKYSEK